MEYEVVIGLEVHTELKTKTKCFCGCKNQFGSPINTNICPVCLGLPGALPVVNKKAVEFCIRAGIGMNCKINNTAIFERKNYYYPDLSKAYQISQLEKNICEEGELHYLLNGEEKVCGIFNIHLEEDAAKLIHEPETNKSLVDFNRCGVPLIEIVTKPDIRSADEAVAVLETIKETLIYLDVSDCKMQEGSLRCDVNISLRPMGSDSLDYNRTEMKNLNSFKAVHRAIEYEVERQKSILNNGGVIERDTLRWDDEKGRNFFQRSKEGANDYKYFPDPDLLYLDIEDSYVEEIRKSLPRLPSERKRHYIEDLGLPQFDANVLTGKKTISDYFENCLQFYNNPKKVSNWIMGDILRKLKDDILEDEIVINVSPENFTNLIKMVENKSISQNASKEVLDKIWETNEPCEKVVEELGLKQVNSEDELCDVVKETINENPQAVSDYKNGNTRALTFFMGQIMKKTRGKANPQIINKLILEELNKI